MTFVARDNRALDSIFFWRQNAVVCFPNQRASLEPDEEGWNKEGDKYSRLLLLALCLCVRVVVVYILLFVCYVGRAGGRLSCHRQSEFSPTQNSIYTLNYLSLDWTCFFSSVCVIDAFIDTR